MDDFEYMREIPTNCRQVLGLYGTEWQCPYCGETEGIKCGMNLCPWCGQRFSWITVKAGVEND